MKHIIVTFTPTSAVIRKTDDLSKEAIMPNVVVDPELGHLVGIPPHYWKLKNGKIVEMTLNEKYLRNIQLAQKNPDNKKDVILRRTPAKLEVRYELTKFGLGFILGALVAGTLWLM